MYMDKDEMLTFMVENGLWSVGWQLLLENLMKFVENFSYKVIPAETGFQL